MFFTQFFQNTILCIVNWSPGGFFIAIDHHD